jgi:K+-transporting ATPase c subunit
MKKHLITAFLMTIATTILLGVIYPLLITGVAQVLFKDKANGQICYRNGEAIGSRIIAQPYFGKIFPPAPLGRRQRIRCRQLRRHESRSHQPETHRPNSG